MPLPYFETPVFPIENTVTLAAGISVYIKREDLNHPVVSGNKWWKLKYNLEEARRLQLETLLTFGGAYSNHIYATAGAAHEMGLKSIGLIRGEESTPLNNTLSFARRMGMALRYVSREDYRTKLDREVIRKLEIPQGDVFIIPEGGSNEYAIRGCREFGESLLEIDFDVLILPVGTGGTMSGLISAIKGTRAIVGVSVLKNGEFLYEDIKSYLSNVGEKDPGNWKLLCDYHHGGYAKTTPALLEFINHNAHLGLPLDHVYTGKMMWALMEEIRTGKFVRGTKILALHTGGLQGAMRMT